MPNRLADQTSPYLQQHAGNPVDWHPWGEEALALAKESGKPILLSVGYSACHWCHVMAHESFEDAEVAQVMNDLFVNVKVDREERPDIDQIYQVAQRCSRHARRLAAGRVPHYRPGASLSGAYSPRRARTGSRDHSMLMRRMRLLRREARRHRGARRQASSPHLPDAAGQRPPWQPIRRRGRSPSTRHFGAQRLWPGASFQRANAIETCLRQLRRNAASAAMAASRWRRWRRRRFRQPGGGFPLQRGQQWAVPASRDTRQRRLPAPLRRRVAITTPFLRAPSRKRHVDDA